MECIDINEGKTGANGVPAAIAGFIGVLFLVFYPLISIIFFVICGIFASITEGVEFDLKTKKYRKYYDLLGLRSGTWKLIPNTLKVNLKLNIESFQVKRWLPRDVRDNDKATERILTFNIILESGERHIVFYEFYKYNHARKALDTISTLLQIPMQDYVQEQMDKR